MQTLQAVFYCFGLILILSSSCVITSKNPVHAAMFLVLAFFTAACLWITLDAEFLAIVLVLVYVGAVMVLFIFVVMMLDINEEKGKKRYINWVLPALIVVGVMLVEVFLVFGNIQNFISTDEFPLKRGAGYSNTKELGRVIYTEYVYAFEIAAVILLVAIVAAIALTLRVRPHKKSIDVAKQVDVESSKRIRLVSGIGDESPSANDEVRS